MSIISGAVSVTVDPSERTAPLLSSTADRTALTASASPPTKPASEGGRSSPASGSERRKSSGEWGELLFGGPHLLLSRSLSGLQVDYTAGSLWGSVFNLCSATLGAGCLALPHSLKQMGTVPALALCALTAWASHLSIVLLAECLHACSVRTYEELAVLAFGKNASRIISGSIFLIVFGSAVAYTIAVGDILTPLIQQPAIKNSMPWLTRDLMMVFFWTLLMLPLSLVEKARSRRPELRPATSAPTQPAASAPRCSEPGGLGRPPEHLPHGR
jgi:hypothetical protein